jgi:hypothetical protein
MKGHAMSVLRNRPAQAKRKRLRFFQIQFLIEGATYQITLLPCDPSIGRKAFRVRKLTGDQAVYDVRFTDHGPECECLGHLRHGHCKHAETIQAAEQVFRLSK